MPERKLRILQLAPRFPFPMDDGGKIGIANILKEFSKKGAEVTFFSFFDNSKNKINNDAINEAKKYADIKLFEHSTKNSPFRIIKSFVNNQSLYIEKHLNDKIKNYITQLVKDKKFDIVHSDHSCMGKLALYVKKICSIPAGLRLHNIEWIIWKRYAENLQRFNLNRLYIEQQAYLLRKIEKELYTKMDACFPITDIDKERAAELAPEGNYIVAGAGVDVNDWSPDNDVRRNPDELILATTFQWKHNIDGIKWFIAEVLPDVKKANPKVKLTLIGKGQPKWLSEFKSLGVKALGYVDKVQPYLNKASIYVAPLFVGSGLRIKILEAMAMELPVIATPVAAEGINAKYEDGLILAENKEMFINNILFLTRNNSYTYSLGKNARKFVLSEFSWEKNTAKILNEYKRLTSGE